MPEHVKTDDQLKKEELMQRWQGRIELAQRYLDKHGNTNKRWTTNVLAMGGDYNSASELGEEAIDVNMVHSTTKSILPPLWLSEPFVSVRATTPIFKEINNEQHAEFTELEINYWLKELQVRLEVKKMSSDAEAMNLGYLYLGYHADKQSTKDEHSTAHKQGQPFVVRISPMDVLVPPGYPTLEECPWMAIRFRKPLVDLKEKYGEERLDGVNTTSYLEDSTTKDDTDSFTSYLGTDDAKVVELFDIWDKRTEKVFKMVKEHDQWLEDPEKWPVKVEGFPLIRYQPESVPDEYFGTPPINYYLPQNKELNATRTAMKKRRSRTKAIVWVDSSISDEVKESYAKAKDGEVVAVPMGEQDEGDIRRRVMIDPGLPFDAGDLTYDAVMKDDIREQSGLGSERRGSGDPNVGSATASANIEKGVQIREADRGDGIKNTYLLLAKKLWMILKQYPSIKRTRLIAGNNAAKMQQIKYTLKELEGEYNFDMDFGAMMADNPQTRVSRAGLNYNLMRGDPKVDSDRLILDLIKAQNISNPVAYLLKLKTPQEELQIMSQGIPVEANERDDHQQHVQQHDAQAEQLNEALSQEEPDSNERNQIARVQILLLSHVTQHELLFAQLGGEQIEGTGKPQAENLLRNQISRERGGETEAEITGGALAPEQLVR